MSDKIAPNAERNEVSQVEAPTDGSPEAARREVLKRLGVYGALLSPALLAAFSSSATAQVVVDSGATN